MAVGGLFDGGCGAAMASADVDQGAGEGVVVNLIAERTRDAEKCRLVFLGSGLSGEEVQ